MKCSVCGYDENKGEEKFIGIFIAGKSFSTTNNNECCLYGCPKCNTIKYTCDSDYINNRKKQYKQH